MKTIQLTESEVRLLLESLNALVDVGATGDDWTAERTTSVAAIRRRLQALHGKEKHART